MDVRKLIEEELSKIAIRPCPVCKTPIVKLDGCNKMTCKCGELMCYVCKKPIDKANQQG